MVTVSPALEEALRQHFLSHKLEISYAIYKPFPFFEGLRDKSFITEKMYRESLEACRNLVPVTRVVYNILSELEKTFHLSCLELLFSPINVREYPNLKTIFKSFKNVVSTYGAQGRTTPALLEVPANPAERSFHPTPLPLPRPQARRPLSPAPRVSEPRASTPHRAEVLGEPSSPAGPAKALPRIVQKGRSTSDDAEDPQQMPSTFCTTVPVARDNVTSQTKGREDAQELSCDPSAQVSVIRNDSPEPNDPTKAQEAPRTPANKKGKKRKRSIWSTSRKRQQKKCLQRGTISPGYRIQQKLQVVDQKTQRKSNSTRKSKIPRKAQKARTEFAQMSGPEEVSDNASDMNEEKRPQEPASTPPRIVPDHLNNGSKLSLGKSPGEKQKGRKKYSCPSSKKRQKKKLPRGTTLSAHKTQENLQVVAPVTQRQNDSTRMSKIMTRAQKARTARAQTPEPEEKRRKKDVCSILTRSCQKNISRKRKSKDETVDFHSPTLPVTCGEAKGILYKEKMKKGNLEKSIQNEQGVWFTPHEFEVKGRGPKSKHWKRNVLCGGNTLGQLMKEGLLVCPLRISLKKEWENSDECAVCCSKEPQLCCHTCPRAFHVDCHIPPEVADRSPWSCTFCRMQESSRSQQRHRKSEVPVRPMGPEEQLKCEFLLLKAYCHPQSSVFAGMPQNIRDYAEPFKEAMWLNLVKERLTEGVYTVAWFVRDMRLIFRNHKTFYKASDFGRVELDLEMKFEKDLKEVFVFHEANENSFQAPP